MTQMIRAVGFDLGGVLASYTMPQQLRFMADSLGVSYYTFLEVFNRQRQELETGRLDEGIFWEAVVTSLGSDGTGGELRDFWNSWYGEHNIISKKMVALVHTLKANGYPVGLLSNIDPDHAATNRQHGLIDIFDVKLLSTELQYLKPDPRAYEALRKGLNVTFTELIFIDDSLRNIAAANLLGINGILFESYAQLIAEFQRLNVKIS